jgi:hypothetical protein
MAGTLGWGALIVGALWGFSKLLDQSPAMKKYNEEHGSALSPGNMTSTGESHIHYNDNKYEINVSGAGDSKKVAENVILEMHKNRYFGDSRTHSF